MLNTRVGEVAELSRRSGTAGSNFSVYMLSHLILFRARLGGGGARAVIQDPRLKRGVQPVLVFRDINIFLTKRRKYE